MAEKNTSGKESDSKSNNDSKDDRALMFDFDDSPLTSPRKEKKDPSSKESPDQPELSPRDVGGAAAAVTDSPSNSPRPKKVSTGASFMTQNSPPRFVSLDEIMKAANGVTNMTLAHDIAVDNDFRFQKPELPANSLEKRVREIMHKAFWDVLGEKLAEDPPDYSRALELLGEFRANVLDLTLPQHQRFRSEIEEVLDIQLISQKAEHGALDVRYYADYIISVMAKLCAPVRDEQIAALKDITEIVPLYRAIFEMLDVLRLDMANFTVQQMRPYLQTQSVEYERKKFSELLKQQEENNLDGLEFTKAWLHRAGDKLSQQGASSSASTTPPAGSPAAILNTAYVELLDWPENYGYPETLLMDHKRFADLKEKSRWLALVASIVMVTYNTVGDPIAGVRTFKEKLKNVIAVLIAGKDFDAVGEVMPSVSAQIVQEVQTCLSAHGYPPMVEQRAAMLSGLVEGVADQQQPVHKLLRSRLLSHLTALLSSPRTQQIPVAPGFSALSDEFSHVYGQFLRLVAHNRAVFGAHYADIISQYLHIKPEGKPAETGKQDS